MILQFFNINILKGSNRFLNILFITVLIFTFTNCSKIIVKKQFKSIINGENKSLGIQLIYPLHGTIFPPEFPAPKFEWNDSIKKNRHWHVFISDSSGKIFIESECEQNNWRPDSTAWQNLKQNIGLNFIFTVIAAQKNNNSRSSVKSEFTFSYDSVGSHIFYRTVPLPFSYAVKNVHTIDWYLGSIDGSKPTKMLENLPVCGNCHSFSNKQPLLAMDVDYGNDKGSYAIASTMDTCFIKSENIITWSDYKKEDNEATFGLLSQISPDGNHVLSTVKDLSIFLAVDDNLAYSQLFFPIKGIIGVYNRENKTFGSLNGANDPKFVQSNPTWSPDGKKVVFTKAEAYINEKVKLAGNALLSINDLEEFSSGKKEFKYDLNTVDFNNGKGGKSKPLEGASNNGKSNYFPKFSPDGKWIVFCQADNYMLLQPDSRLYIMPAEGGIPRLMNCNMAKMNSWHSWSPNGKWLVFSSKNKGPYTQLYLTHIDENGMDSPPVLLENLGFDKRAANIPEFYPFDADEFTSITDDFSNTAFYYNQTAFDKISYKFYKRAFDDLNKAIEIDSNYLESYFNRIMLNSLVHRSNSKQDLADKHKALNLVLDSLKHNPDDLNYLSLEISLLSGIDKTSEAIAKTQLAINKHPQSYKLYELLSSVYRRTGQYDEAITCYRKMLELDPNKKQYLNNQIAIVYLSMNQQDKALKITNELIRKYPDNHVFIMTRIQIMLSKKDFNNAKFDIDYLVGKDSLNYSFNELLAQYHLQKGHQQQYNLQVQKLINILSDLHYENREDIEHIFKLASVYLSIQDYKLAEDHYNSILKNFPINYEALKQKAIIKLSMNKWHEAIAIFDKLEANYPLEESFCNNKAIAYIQIGNVSKALEYFYKTLQLNPENKDAAFNINKLLHETTNR